MRPEPKPQAFAGTLLELVRMTSVKLRCVPKRQRAEAQQVSDYSGPQSCSLRKRLGLVHECIIANLTCGKRMQPNRVGAPYKQAVGVRLTKGSAMLHMLLCRTLYHPSDRP
jgi:hypothetical protein